jgi:xanthine dehydrogenase accessory factor
VDDPQAPHGWRWQRLSEYAAALSPDQYQKVVWPAQDPDDPREVHVHVVTTRFRKLYKCQVIIARPSLDCPPQAVRYIGVLSSSRTHQKRLKRLTEAGISLDLQARITTPIGLDINARTPEEIALCIMAEIVAVRNQA